MPEVEHFENTIFANQRYCPILLNETRHSLIRFFANNLKFTTMKFSCYTVILACATVAYLFIMYSSLVYCRTILSVHKRNHAVYKCCLDLLTSIVPLIVPAVTAADARQPFAPPTDSREPLSICHSIVTGFW